MRYKKSRGHDPAFFLSFWNMHEVTSPFFARSTRYAQTLARSKEEVTSSMFLFTIGAYNACIYSVIWLFDMDSFFRQNVVQELEPDQGFFR